MALKKRVALEHAFSFQEPTILLVSTNHGDTWCILGNPGLQRGWEGKGETGSGKKGEGSGREGKEERGSPGKLLYTDHFSIEEQTPLARCETEALI